MLLVSAEKVLVQYFSSVRVYEVTVASHVALMRLHLSFANVNIQESSLRGKSIACIMRKNENPRHDREVWAIYDSKTIKQNKGKRGSYDPKNEAGKTCDNGRRQTTDQRVPRARKVRRKWMHNQCLAGLRGTRTLLLLLLCCCCCIAPMDGQVEGIKAKLLRPERIGRIRIKITNPRAHVTRLRSPR